MTVDIHTHLFNLRYLPLKGIIDARANGILTKFAAKALVKYLLWRTDDDDTLDETLVKAFDGGKIHESMASRMSVLDTLTRQSALTPIEELDLEEFLIAEAVLADDLMADPDMLSAVFEVNGVDPAQPNLKLLDADLVRAIPILMSSKGLPAKEFSLVLSADPKSAESMRGGLVKLLRPLFRRFAQLGDFWHWLVLQTESETKIMKTLIETYSSDDSNGGNVDLYIDHMMDMELHYPGQKKPVYQEPKTRMQRMRKLYQNSNGLVLGFYAWCPLRDDALDLVKHAIEKEGFVGVKFYSPNGYRAQENNSYEAEDIDNKVVRGGVSGSLIDERNHQLFDYCNANRVPIFSHSQPGEMESVSGYTGKMSHPRYFSSVFENFEDLIVCFGHAGGSDGWLPPVRDGDPWKGTDQSQGDYATNIDLTSYARAIYDACVNNKHVYCGVGAHSEISNKDSIVNFRERLTLLFRQSSGNPGQVEFGQRISYGSDWHMIFKHRKHALYLQNYQKVFESGSGLEGSRDLFFEKNMLNFLHLPDYLSRAGGSVSQAHKTNIENLISRL